MRLIWGLLAGRSRERRGTHAVGEVGDQVGDLDVADLELAVKPARVSAPALARSGRLAHHLVNVFCWTLTHCCSSGAMFAGCGHQCWPEVRGVRVAIGGQGGVQCRVLVGAGALVLLAGGVWWHAWVGPDADSAVRCGAPGNRSKLAPAGGRLSLAQCVISTPNTRPVAVEISPGIP
jgi:hypothetical protein